MRSRFAFFVLGFVVVSALANGFSLIFRLGYLIAAGIAFSWGWAFVHTRGVAVRTSRMATRAQVGESFHHEVELRNTLRIPKVGLEVRELSDLPGYEQRMVIDLGPRETRFWSPDLVCTRRGQYTIGPIEVTGSDPFGIFEFTRRFGEPQRLTVYPPTYDMPDFAIAGPELPGEERFQQRTHYVTQNVSTVRDYVFGDSYNRIHWPSTARTNRIMVKEFEQEPGSNVWVVLDLQASAHYGQGDDSTEEYAVTVAASVARKYLNSALSVGLIAFGAVPQVVPAEKGPAQLGRLLEAFAVARATGRRNLSEVILTESARFTRSTTLIIVTSSTNPGAVSSMDYVMRRGVRCVVIFIEPTTFGSRVPNTPEFVARLVASAIPVYRLSRRENVREAIRTMDASLATLFLGSGR